MNVYNLILIVIAFKVLQCIFSGDRAKHRPQQKHDAYIKEITLREIQEKRKEMEMQRENVIREKETEKQEKEREKREKELNRLQNQLPALESKYHQGINVIEYVTPEIEKINSRLDHMDIFPYDAAMEKEKSKLLKQLCSLNSKAIKADHDISRYRQKLNEINRLTLEK